MKTDYTIYTCDICKRKQSEFLHRLAYEENDFTGEEKTDVRFDLEVCEHCIKMIYGYIQELGKEYAN